MHSYTISLLLGVGGLGVMALSGVGHRSSGAHRAAGRHGAHGSHGAHNSHGVRGHGQRGASGHGAGKLAARAQSPDAVHLVWHSVRSLLSPRVLFSLALGFGTAGLVLHGLREPWRGALSALTALLFERLFVMPLWNFGFRFASRPARTLEDALLDYATAVTSFDESGNGLVQLELDGHVIQVLGVLDAEGRASGIKVRAGDRLCIEHIDATRNRCVVSFR